MTRPALRLLQLTMERITAGYKQGSFAFASDIPKSNTGDRERDVIIDFFCAAIVRIPDFSDLMCGDLLDCLSTPSA